MAKSMKDFLENLRISNSPNMVLAIRGLPILFFIFASVPYGNADDTLYNRNPTVIEDTEIEISEPNPEPIKTDEVEGRFMEDNQVKTSYGFDR